MPISYLSAAQIAGLAISTLQSLSTTMVGQMAATQVAALTVTEVDAPMFAIPATAIVKGRIPARCLLVDGPDDAGLVLRQLHGKGIDRVVPLLLSIRG